MCKRRQREEIWSPVSVRTREDKEREREGECMLECDACE